MASTEGAQRQLNGLIQDDRQKNTVAVHAFDPDASPEEKAAAAGKGRDQLKSVASKNEDRTGGRGLFLSLPENLLCDAALCILNVISL